MLRLPQLLASPKRTCSIASTAAATSCGDQTNMLIV
ncbi:F15O4.2 [Arabidopsis thaliana]|uniref:F15O4.2 n=1 Tax=Arabidopsis thaliana TaxID=3702 RepID=Q9LQI2_ARATH|nr:F15O4.2 [Arabidopsis thaliana]